MSRTLSLHLQVSALELSEDVQDDLHLLPATTSSLPASAVAALFLGVTAAVLQYSISPYGSPESPVIIRNVSMPASRSRPAGLQVSRPRSTGQASSPLTRTVWLLCHVQAEPASLLCQRPAKFLRRCLVLSGGRLGRPSDSRPANGRHPSDFRPARRRHGGYAPDSRPARGHHQGRPTVPPTSRGIPTKTRAFLLWSSSTHPG